MTLGTEIKKYLILWYPEAFLKRKPKDYQVVIQDMMANVKYKPEGINTARNYINYILRSVKKALNDPNLIGGGVTHYYMLLDKGCPPAKSLFAHPKRKKKGVYAMEDSPEEVFNPYVIPESNDGHLPFNWDSFVANRELTKRELYWLFYKAVMDPDVGITPNQQQCVLIHGAPSRRLTKSEQMKDPEAFDRVYFAKTIPPPVPGQPARVIRAECELFKNNHVREADLATMFYAMQSMHTNQNVLLDVIKQEEEEQGKQQQQQQQQQQLQTLTKEDFNSNIDESGPTLPDIKAPNDDGSFGIPWKEGEKGAPERGILIDMNDGDIISIALLFAAERMDPMTGKFRNKMYLRLPGSGKKTRNNNNNKKGKGNGPDIDLSCDYYVDVNKLYHMIKFDKRFRGSGVQNPHLTLVSLIILCGTDFFGDYQHDNHGLFYGMGNIPYVIDTFFDNAKKYSHLFQLYYSNTYGRPDILREPKIDEYLFIEFVYDCYRSKYGKQAKKKYGDDGRISLIKYSNLAYENLLRKKGETEEVWKKRLKIDDNKPDWEEKYEKRLKQARRKRIPPTEIITRYGRLLLWHLLYWYNEYRPGSEKLLDPLRKEGGLPHYGFDYDEDEDKHFLSPVISKIDVENIEEVYRRNFSNYRLAFNLDDKSGPTIPLPKIITRKKKKKKRKAESSEAKEVKEAGGTKRTEEAKRTTTDPKKNKKKKKKKMPILVKKKRKKSASDKKNINIDNKRVKLSDDSQENKNKSSSVILVN